MIDATTVLHADPVTCFLATISDAGRRAQALELDALFRDVTGFAPAMWGPGMVGYGRYHYAYAGGSEGDFMATGFAPRDADFAIYILPGYSGFGDILGRLGPYRTGKACLYLDRLDAVDAEALKELIRAGLEDLARRRTILPG